MNGREMVKVIMDEQGINNATAANRMGITQATLWERLNNKKTRDIPLSTFCDMLRALDCELIVVPVGKGRNIAGAKKVTADEGSVKTNAGWKRGVKRKTGSESDAEGDE